MKRGTRIVKRLLALFLVVLMSINTLAAVVGDNDGAAFITKAEFDSIKNDFQSQLDRYNSSIDNKIDGAIASYLAGIRIGTRDVSIPYFIENADGETTISFREGSSFPFQKESPAYEINFIGASRRAKSDILRVSMLTIVKENEGNNNGRKVLVESAFDKYRWLGYMINGYEYITGTWSIVDVQDYTAAETLQFYIFSPLFNGTENTVYNSQQLSALGTFVTSNVQNWGDNIWDPVFRAKYTKGTFQCTQRGTLSSTKDAIFSDAIYNDGVFLNNEQERYMCDSRWSVTNNDGWISSNASFLYRIWNAEGGSNKDAYVEPSVGTKGSVASDLLTNHYFICVAPIDFGSNDYSTQWKDILYNDSRTYTYKKDGASTTLKNYSMTAGLPLKDVEDGDSVEWTYEFTTADINRKVYLKYGVFNDENISADGVMVFDAPNKIGEIKFTSTKTDMVFIKWSAGSSLVCEGSDTISIERQN